MVGPQSGLAQGESQLMDGGTAPDAERTDATIAACLED